MTPACWRRCHAVMWLRESLMALEADLERTSVLHLPLPVWARKDVEPFWGPFSSLFKNVFLIGEHEDEIRTCISVRNWVIQSFDVSYLSLASDSRLFWDDNHICKIIPGQAPGCASGPIKARLRWELTFARELKEWSGAEPHQGTQLPILSRAFGWSGP